ncbi:MAG: hypothetical protein FWG64_11040 [Firmicutes bacterium]|nr:hypothetical protein [Bacillota bacterium]
MIIFKGTLFMILFFVAAALISGMGVFFVDIIFIVFILVALAVFMWLSASGKIIRTYVKTSLQKDYSYSASEFAQIATACKNTIKFIMGTGFILFMFGLVQLLGRLDTPEVIGIAVAMSLISLLYALAVSFLVFCPLQAWAENKLAEM